MSSLLSRSASRRALRSVGVGAALAITPLLTACPPTGGPPATVDQNYMSCSGPDAEYIYRFTPEQRLDVFKHIAGDARGTIVFVHGGGFSGGDKRGNPVPDCPSAAYANIHMGPLLKQRENGWDIVTINYRLVTGDAATKFPGALIDTIEAVKWVQGLGGQLAGVNASRVIVAGHSAGGTIAALMGAYSGTQGALPGVDFPSVNGWIGISAPLDYNEGNAKANIDAWVAGNPFGYTTAQANPMVQYNRPGRPAGYLIHANNDLTIPVVNAQNMANAYGIPLDNVGDVSYPSPDWSWATHWPMSQANYPNLLNWLAVR